MAIDPIFKLIESKHDDEAIGYVQDGKLIEIDCVDESGTTPLQYASFRGCTKLCKLLIDKGANVNAKTHAQGYSALMFAAISNHVDIVQLLLEHNADTEIKNSIGRTCTEMAAFVNSHEAVDLINNFMPKETLEFFTQLPKECHDALHKIIVGTNFNPIHVIKLIKDSKQTLIPHLKQIITTLDELCTKSFKPSGPNSCPNDVVAIRMHHYKFIFEFLHSQLNNLKLKNNLDELNDGQIEKLIDFLIKKLIKNEENSEFCKYQEEFVRESIRSFPYHECALIKQMAQILSKVKIGSKPSALSVLTDCLNGQKLSSNEGIHSCNICDRRHAKLCTSCRKVAYCDQYCQKLDWTLGHKKECKSS